MEGDVPDGDGQHEEASDNATSPVQGHDDDVEQHNNDSDQRSQLQDAADEPQLATDTGDRPDYDDELLESKTTLQRQSGDGSTEPAADCSHSPPTGILPRRIASAVLATAIPSIPPSVLPSLTRRYCVKTTARSTMQFALSDSKMCLVL